MDILVVQDGPVLRVMFNRPDRGNTFSEDMILAVTEAVAGAQARAKLVVVSGKGDDFCAGRVPSQSPADPMERRRWGDSVFRCYDTFRRSVPSIAVVKGRAFGFGCAIAALCDITLAGEGAQFRLSEMANNVMPANAMSALIGRLSYKAIAYLALTAEPIGARSAKEAGLVSEVVPEAALDETAARLTAKMAAMPAVALGGVKEYLRAASDMSMDGAVEFARNLHATINASEEMRKK